MVDDLFVTLGIVEASSAESVSKGSGLMAGTPDPGAFVCFVLYTGVVHILYNNFAILWAAAARLAAAEASR